MKTAVFCLSVTLLSLLFFRQLEGQEANAIDSLQTMYQLATHDSARILLLAEISQQYSFNNPDTALAIGRRGLQLAEQLNDQKGEALCLVSVANAYFTQSNYKESWVMLSRALQISESMNDQQTIAYVLLSMGNIYYYQNNKTLALENYQKCLAIGEQLHDTATCARAYINIGCIYLDQRDFDKGLEYLFKAARNFEQSYKKRELCYCYRNIAMAYQLQGRNSSAIDFLNKSLRLAEEQQNKEMISGCLQSLAENFRLTGKNNQSVEFGKKALKIAQEINDLPYVKGAATTLFECYRQQDDFQRALEYYIMAKTASDGILNTEKNKELKTIQHQYALEGKQKEIELLEQKGKNQRMLLAFVASGLGLSILLALVVFRSFRKERIANDLHGKQKAEILDKHKKLTILNEEHAKLIQELQKALENVKTLTGLLPMCANCKKIRDDGGYWQAVEGYIMEHTEAKFSHGVCPECMEILYPEYMAKLRKKKPTD
jgi:two-component system NtrC family sensor kinase